MKKVIAVVAALVWIISPANAEETLYCQGMVCSTTPPDPNKFANFDVKNEQGEVVSSIWGYTDYYDQPNVKTENNDTTCANCSVSLQPKPAPEPVNKISVIDSTTVFMETATALIESATATVGNVKVSDVYAQIMALLNKVFQLFAILNR
jgi:tRNA-binding EMAP/Myf-like protein